MVLALPLTIKWVRKALTHNDDGVWDYPVTGVPIVIACIIAFLGFMFFCFDIQQLMLVWFAPRVYILQWIMSGLK